MQFLASEGCFWPPIASMTSEVKNNYAYMVYVVKKDICNKFIGCKKFCGLYGLMAKLSFKIEHPLIIDKICARYEDKARHSELLYYMHPQFHITKRPKTLDFKNDLERSLRA